MPLTKFLPGIAALCLAASGAAAQGTHCENPQTQAQLRHCEQSRYEAADKALNEQWSLALAGIAREEDGERIIETALLNAQRAWITFRDLQCKAAGLQARGGTLEPVIVVGCLADMTLYRIKELEVFVASMKGN